MRRRHILRADKNKPTVVPNAQIPASMGSGTNLGEFKYYVTFSSRLDRMELITLNMLIAYFLEVLSKVSAPTYEVSWSSLPNNYRTGDNRYGLEDEIAFALIDYFEEQRIWQLRIEYHSKKIGTAYGSDLLVFKRQ